MLFRRIYGDQVLNKRVRSSTEEEVIDEWAAGVAELSDGYVLLLTTTRVGEEKKAALGPCC